MTYLRREDCGSCERQLGAKINIWMQKGNHDMPSEKCRKEKFASIRNNRENIFHVARQMRTENQDVIGEKCIRGDDGNHSLDDASKKQAWKQL